MISLLRDETDAPPQGEASRWQARFTAQRLDATLSFAATPAIPS